jgi:hypothetical protein
LFGRCNFDDATEDFIARLVNLCQPHHNSTEQVNSWKYRFEDFYMATNYLPVPDADFNNWVLNFNSLITANPGTYGLTAGDAAAIATPTANWSAAYTLAVTPATRTPVTVSAKNTEKAVLTAVVRSYGRIILANAGVSDSNKTALGLNVRDPVNSPIPAPVTNPVLGLIGAQPGQITLTYHDSAASATVKAKPFGATQLELRAFFGTTAPVSPAATPYYGVFTRTPFAVNAPSGSAGQSVWFYGRWLTAKGLAGPWSAVLQTTAL